jgi:hypothetical protein
MNAGQHDQITTSDRTLVGLARDRFARDRNAMPFAAPPAIHSLHKIQEFLSGSQ